MDNNFWIEVYGEASDVLQLLSLNKVTNIYRECKTIYAKDDNEIIHYYLYFNCDNELFYRAYKSELERDMVYAKFKKLLCTNEDLNEIL